MSSEINNIQSIHKLVNILCFFSQINHMHIQPAVIVIQPLKIIYYCDILMGKGNKLLYIVRNDFTMWQENAAIKFSETI